MSSSNHGLSGLPPELLHLICTLCALPEIRSLRRTCRAVSAVADEYLLGPVLELYFARESVRFARDIAARPRIARSVRFVCFHADRLNGQKSHTVLATSTDDRCGVLSYPDWVKEQQGDRLFGAWAGWSMIYPGSPLRIVPEEWWGKLLNFEPAHAMAFDQAPEARRQAYEHYLRVQSEQDALDRDGSFQTMWEALFGACPNLEDVLVTAGDSLAPTTTYRVRDFQKARVFPKSDPDTLASCVHALNSLVLAACNSGKTLRMLGAGRVALEFFLQQDRQDNRVVAEAAATVFASLQKIMLQFETPMEFNLQPEYEEEFLHRVLHNPSNRQVPKLLCQSQQLQDLTIILPGRSENGRIKLESILGAHPHWPKLRRLRLDWCQTDEDYLAAFLLRHRCTLTHLYLADIHLVTGRWSSVFQRLAGQFEALSNVRLRSVLDQQDLTHPRYYAFPGHSFLQTIGLGQGGSMSARAEERLRQYVISGKQTDPPPLPDGVSERGDAAVDGIDDYLNYWVLKS